MSGLIWAGIGQGIANAGRTAGDFMMRSELEEERQREKAELQRERLAATERENERNRQLRADIEAGRAARAGDSGGGLSMKDIGEGGSAEGLVARQAGMTVPELRAMRRYSETGDSTPFQVETNKITMKDTGDPYNPDTESQLVKELPPGFEREAKAKLKTLARIEESYLLGKNYEPVAKGRQTQQEVDASQRAMESPAQAGIIGQGIAAGQGKDLIGGDSNVTRNKFTGETSVTPVGQSVITENRAQAGQASAAARLSGAKADAVAAGEDPDVINSKTADLQRQINSAKARLARELGVAENEVNSTLRSLNNNKSAEAQARLEKVKPFVDSLDKAQAAMDNWKPGKTKSKDENPGAAPKPAPAPAAGGELPAPKTPEEVARLKPGTRFRAPDGSIRYR